jgi:hypothetical protein
VDQKKNTFYVKDFDSSKKQIDAVSPTFCAAKWLQVSLHLTNGKTHSCYHPPTHSIDVSELDANPAALHNTTQKFQERKLMLSGQRPSGCDYCWKIEDAGHVSDRYYRSSEHWAKHKIIEITKQPFDFNVVPTYVEVNFNQTCNFKCAYCSPHLSSEWEHEIKKFGAYKINGQEHNDIVTLKNIGLMPIDESTKNNPYVQAFWRWWPNIYKDLEVFRMTGGEPLLDANTFKILDYVYENPNKNLELGVTSNLCPPRQDIFDRFLEKVKLLDSADYNVECYVPDPKDGSAWQTWPHFVIGAKEKAYHNNKLPSIERNDIPQTFPAIGHALEDDSFTYLYNYKDQACKHFILYVSLDSVDAHAEYLRNGLDFEMLKNNVRRFLKETTNTSVSFINTFNLLSIPKFKNYLEFVLELRKEFSRETQSIAEPFQRIWFDIPLLRKPEWLSIFNASDAQIEELKIIHQWMKQHTDIVSYNRTFMGFKPFELDKLERNIQMIADNKYNVEIVEQNKKDFKEFFEEHDKRRQQNFVDTFPELAEWYRNIT